MQVFQNTETRKFFPGRIHRRTYHHCAHHPDRVRIDRCEHDLAIVCAAWVVSTPGLSFSALVGAAGPATWRLTTTALSLASASV